MIVWIIYDCYSDDDDDDDEDDYVVGNGDDNDEWADRYWYWRRNCEHKTMSLDTRVYLEAEYNTINKL